MMITSILKKLPWVLRESSSENLKKVCLIAGAGHSGTTLLGFLLGSHSEAFCGGELANTEYFGDNTYKERKRTCKFCGPDCEVWGEFDVDPDIDLYSQLADRVRKQIIIDTTKDVSWLKSSIKLLSGYADVDLYLIYMKRDGRAVINSWIRKGSNDPDKLIGRWIRHIKSTNRLYNRFDGHKCIVHYERLATSPDSEIHRICDWMGIEFQPEMIQYQMHAHHPLGGNLGTQYIVAKAQDMNDNFELSDDKRKFYDKEIKHITLDERWKEELSSEHHKLFESRAGKLNAEFVCEIK